MKLEDIARQRLVSQHIAQADFKRPEDVVRYLLAMQAQDYNGALWAIGLRTKNCTQKDVEKAIADKKIVRTWPMRGTLHFLHADDARWMVQLLAHRATAAAKTRRLALGLSDKVMDEAEAVVREVLSDGKYLSRPKLMQILSERIKGVEVGNNQAGHIFRNFGERGIVCFGPHDGKQPTFVLMDDWLPKTPQKDHDEALGELAKRYFISHGPAQLTDMAGWAGITMGDAKKALELAKSELETVVVSDTTYYLGRDLKPAKGSRTCLLPGFDEFMLGYKDRSAALALEHSQKIVPGGNGMFMPTIIDDGQVVGTWKRTERKSSVVLSPSLFAPKTKLSEPDFRAAVTRYGTFLAKPVSFEM